jgi:hypothetical protein
MIADYKLTKVGPKKTRIDIAIKEKWKIPNPPTKAEYLKHASEIWHKYATALENDYGNNQK